MVLQSASEEQLHELGRWLLATGSRLPSLPATASAHVLRGIWDRAGFIGLNNGGYPVASLLVHRELAEQVAEVIEEVTGRRSPARPLGPAYWVGASGKQCALWLRYLYADTSGTSPTRVAQVRALLDADQ